MHDAVCWKFPKASPHPHTPPPGIRVALIRNSDAVNSMFISRRDNWRYVVAAFMHAIVQLIFFDFEHHQDAKDALQ
jgi:hypothetical protein